MANAGLQLLGFILAFLGWIGSIVSTALPQWKIYSYAGDNIVTAQAIYEGLWMSCVSQSTGQIQCKVFDSLLNLNSTLQATRALMVIGILLGLIAIFVATVGMKCMKCLEDDEVQKMRMAVIGGVIFLIAGLAVLVATAWYGNRIVQEFYDPMTPVNYRIYIRTQGQPCSALCPPSFTEPLPRSLAPYTQLYQLNLEWSMDFLEVFFTKPYISDFSL
uniref:Claudin n=1 Tax=Ursus americanus TaxID=9643 RepID=A0A452R8A7_URSAM